MTRLQNTQQTMHKEFILTQARMTDLHPFNLTAHEYDAMYHGPLPSVIAAGLLVSNDIDAEGLWNSLELHMNCDEPGDDDVDESGSEARAGDIAGEELAWLDPRSSGLSCRIDLRYANRARLRYFSEGWGLGFPFHEDPYDLQLVFCCDWKAAPGFPVDAMLVSMDLFDHLVIQAGSCDAQDHPAIPVNTETATAYEILVGDVYRSGWGHMNRLLIEYRNKVLIAAGAILSGRDPVDEYRRFVAAGGWYYLQYPNLCP